MSQKRMFSKQIIDSDAFLDMPPSSQLLYFHLVMRADDEGFVGNPKKIMREVGIQGDDFKILVSKRFLIVFETGVVVIKHWLIHNTIRMDRFNKTSYIDEKKLIITKENKAYTELATNGLPDGNHLEPQVKLSKVKLSKVNINTPEQSSGENDFINLFKEINPTYQSLFARKNQREASKRLLKLRPLEEWNKVITFISSRRSDRFSPRISTPIQLEQKYADLETYAQGLKTTQSKNKIYGL